nr:breast carcinoma-amplified sequence 3 homolog isoform X2 [Bactrocera oleae]
MSADSPRRQSRGIAAPAVVPPQVVSDRSILDSAFGFISDVTLVAHQSHTEPKDTIIWARFETAADISDPCFGIDWEMEGSAAPPLLLLLGYGLGVQVWAIPANGEAIEVLSWRHGVVSTLRVLPTPTLVRSANEHGRADESIDMYAEKRPIIALVDSSTASSQLQFCTINFVSLKTGKQVKTIKFKNVILDVLANRSSIVIVFHERIAVFDARTLEDRLSITTCYPSPGINPNPVALGQRWLAYAEQRLIPSKRSGGGWDGEGVASYTATVLNAAKSFGKGLRELGEQVAAGLTGTSSGGSISKNSSFDSITGVEAKQSGIVTIMDIERTIKDYSPTSMTSTTGGVGEEPIIAHFVAHAEAIVAMEFDNSGMLLLTADRRGHDFNVFRIQPHPASPSLSAVHHLYVLHRGDTSAKVQNITFSLDSRWVAVSTLRGTTHVFPITPYGGPMGVRTHTSLHVVNKLSRFHRSAGLSAEGRSNSPISHSESTTFMQSLQPYYNTTLPPFPRPTIVQALAQLRQPFALGSPPGSAGLVMPGKIGVGNSGISAASQRQRHSSLSDDNGKPLSVCAIFAKSRSWLLEPPNVTREASHRVQRKSVDSLFVMAGHGALIQYDLDTKLASNIAKDKICDDTPIELEVEAKAQWNLGRRRDGSHELAPPLENDNWLIKDRNLCLLDSIRQYDELEEKTESWVSQVEIITHAGPHRRLWMGPQCVFKTYNTPSGSNLNHVDVEAVEIGVSKSANSASAIRSHPLSMPVTAAARCSLPVLIESGSYSSVEQSPKLMDRFRHEHLDSDFAMAHGDSRLKEDLADAMRESPSVSDDRKNTCRLASGVASSDNVPFYDARAEPDIGEDDSDNSLKAMVSYSPSLTSTSETLTAMGTWNLVSDVDSDQYKKVQLCCDENKKISEIQKSSTPSVEKVVNPLGTVTTVFSGISTDVKRDILDEVVSQLAAEESIIHENCDESLFRPVVAILCDENINQTAGKTVESEEFCKPPELIKNKLIVPVIAKEVDAELSKRERNQKSGRIKTQNTKKLNLCSTESNKPTTAVLISESGNIQQHVRSELGDMVELVHGNNVNKCNTTNSVNLCDNTNTSEMKKNLKSLSSVKEDVIEFKRMTPLPIVKIRNKPNILGDRELVKGNLSQIESEPNSKVLKSPDTKNNSKKLSSVKDNAQLEQTISDNFSIEIDENKIGKEVILTNLMKSTEYPDTSNVNTQIGEPANNSSNLKTLSKNNIKCDKLSKETELKLDIAIEAASTSKTHENKDTIRSPSKIIEKASDKGNEAYNDASIRCNNIIEQNVTMNITKKEKNSLKKKTDNEISKNYAISAHLDNGNGKLTFVQSNSEICESPQISKPNNSVWQTVSSENQLKSKVQSSDNFPSLGTIGKTKKNVKIKEIMTEKKGNILSDLSTISKPIDNSCTGLGGTIKKNTKSKANITENSEIKSSNSSKQLKSIEKEQIDVKLRGQLIVTANGHSMDFPYCNHWNHYRLCPH